MDNSPNLDGFIVLFNRQNEMVRHASQEGRSEQVGRNLIMRLLAYRTAFEALTANDPELRSYVTDRISVEWARDRSPKITPLVLERIPCDSESAVKLGMSASIDLGGFMRIYRIRLEKQARAVANGQGEHVMREHALVLSAYRETFDVLNDASPALRQHLADCISMDWDANR